MQLSFPDCCIFHLLSVWCSTLPCAVTSGFCSSPLSEVTSGLLDIPPVSSCFRFACQVTLCFCHIIMHPHSTQEHSLNNARLPYDNVSWKHWFEIGPYSNPGPLDWHSSLLPLGHERMLQARRCWRLSFMTEVFVLIVMIMFDCLGIFARAYYNTEFEWQ